MEGKFLRQRSKPQLRWKLWAEKVDNYRDERVRKLQKLVTKQLAEIRSPDFVRTQDKVLFSVGVANVCCLAYFVGALPQVVPWWYILWSLILIPVRFVIYHRLSEHFFMLDFCYLANYLTIFYLYFLPSSTTLFNIVFTCANGPLLWAICAWRNSLVFHDLDKCTSVFIHALPPIITFVVRWLDVPAYRFDPDATSTEFYVGALFIYAYWQVSYYLKTEWVDVKVMYADPVRRQGESKHVTSFRYLKQPQNKTFIGHLLAKFPERYRIWAFMGIQLVYTVLTILPVPLMYHYKKLHSAVLLFVLGVSVWNGATFFIDKFSTIYAQKLQLLSDRISQLPSASGSVVGSSLTQPQSTESIGNDSSVLGSESGAAVGGSRNDLGEDSSKSGGTCGGRSRAERLSPSGAHRAHAFSVQDVRETLGHPSSSLSSGDEGRLRDLGNGLDEDSDSRSLRSANSDPLS